MHRASLRSALPFLLLILAGAAAAQNTIPQRVDSLLRLMTLEEKIGQLNQYTDNGVATGPVTPDNEKERQVMQGKVGSILNVLGMERTRAWQAIAMRSRLRIPLLFGQDVVHGYKTTFPIPLAESCSWDLEAIERAARVAAVEASAGGVHWTFAPMVDIGRDPRWGRVMEGAGEDTYLGSLIAAARVRGFQGRGLGSTDAVMACVKHYAAYGAAVGGRDYNSVDMSERMLWETYLPPFKAAIDAGAGTVMTSFNDLNGVPATGNAYLLRDILKGRWNFGGFVVSDWGSVGEMINHGSVKDAADAARSALLAGTDMDMESRCYTGTLARLVADGAVPAAAVDDAVRRVLTKKFELGLFDDPFRFCDPAREERALNDPAHADAARDMARKSIVLLKNDRGILPLAKGLKTVAFIGPLVKEVKQNKGFWDVELPGVDSNFIVTQWEGVSAAVSRSTTLLYAKGCDIDGTDRSGFAEAVRIAKKADVVILSIGERRDMSGEAKSRSDLSLPGVQEELAMELLKTGTPVVVLINAGRPLVFNGLAEKASAILYTWWLGSEAGNAVADVLFGDHNPSAKLTMTFPRSVGQIPVYYDHYNTGRPATGDGDRFYRSAYTDLSIHPRYEFGYGLGYSPFTYGGLQLSARTMTAGGSIRATLTVTNAGRYAGEEVVQLYLRDLVGSVVRPVKELRGFRKVRLAPGETKSVTFTIDRESLSFYDRTARRVVEPGEFELMIGASSRDIRLKERFELVP